MVEMWNRPAEQPLAKAANSRSGSVMPSAEVTLVSLSEIYLHEEHDPKRVQLLAAAIANEHCQRHPIILGDVKNGALIHLDGATRIKALQQLKCQHVAAQVLNYKDEGAISLNTWSHLTRLTITSLQRLAGSSQHYSLERLRGDDVFAHSRRRRFLSVVIFSNGDVFGLSCEASLGAKVKLLGTLSLAYELPPFREVIELEGYSGAQAVFESHPHTNALVAFGGFTKDDVCEIALDGGRLFPPGITRHIVNCGRILHVNAPIALLESAASLEEKREQFGAMLAKRQKRVYQEATIQFEN